MKNLRKTGCIAMGLLLAFSVLGCGTAGNYPGAQTNTGNAAIGAGTAIVPRNSAITGTNTGMNVGTNLGLNPRTTSGLNPGTGYLPRTVGTTTTSRYKDGTYTASGNPMVNGSDTATITVRGGKITAVVLRRLDKAGKEVSYSEANTGTSLKNYRNTLARQIIANQGTNVGTITGMANAPNNGWLTAARRALDKAKA
jgi:uncharacterized protein with FMN-binding domain